MDTIFQFSKKKKKRMPWNVSTESLTMALSKKRVGSNVGENDMKKAFPDWCFLNFAFYLLDQVLG